MNRLYMTLAALVIGLAATSTPAAEYAGVVKTARGTVTAERGDAKIPLTPGSRIEQSDRIVTGTDGLVGITMRDDTLLTLGPRSQLSLDTYAFDAKTHQGTFLASLKHGVLSVVTGLLPRHSPQSFAVKTPISTMGVRGTEFVIEAQE